MVANIYLAIPRIDDGPHGHAAIFIISAVGFHSLIREYTKKGMEGEASQETAVRKRGSEASNFFSSRWYTFFFGKIHQPPKSTLTETNVEPENGRLEDDRFLLGGPIFRGFCC